MSLLRQAALVRSQQQRMEHNRNGLEGDDMCCGCDGMAGREEQGKELEVYRHTSVQGAGK